MIIARGSDRRTDKEGNLICTSLNGRHSVEETFIYKFIYSLRDGYVIEMGFKENFELSKVEGGVS